MRDCGTYEAWISALLDGELDPKYQVELMDHLADCPGCRQYFDDLMAMGDALADMEASAPGDFAQSVMDAVARTPQVPAKKDRRAARPWRRWAAMAACLVLAVGTLWWTEIGRKSGTANDAAVNYAAAPGAAAPQYGETAAGNDICSTDEGGVCPTGVDGFKNAGAECDTEPSESAQMDEALQSAEKRGELFPAALTTESGAAKAWVKEQGWIWTPGAEYLLTAEQYGELLELLEEGEYTLSPSEDGGCRLIAR